MSKDYDKNKNKTIQSDVLCNECMTTAFNCKSRKIV